MTPKQVREKRSEAEFGGGGRTFSEVTVNMVRLDLLFFWDFNAIRSVGDRRKGGGFNGKKLLQSCFKPSKLLS